MSRDPTDIFDLNETLRVNDMRTASRQIGPRFNLRPNVLNSASSFTLSQTAIQPGALSAVGGQQRIRVKGRKPSRNVGQENSREYPLEASPAVQSDFEGVLPAATYGSRSFVAVGAYQDMRSRNFDGDLRAVSEDQIIERNVGQKNSHEYPPEASPAVQSDFEEGMLPAATHDPRSFSAVGEFQDAQLHNWIRNFNGDLHAGAFSAVSEDQFIEYDGSSDQEEVNVGHAGKVRESKGEVTDLIGTTSQKQEEVNTNSAPSNVCSIIYPRPATEWLVNNLVWVSEAEKLHIHIYSDVWVTEEGALEPVVKLDGPRNDDVVSFADNLVQVCGFKVLLEFHGVRNDNEDVARDEGGNRAGDGNGNEGGGGGGGGNGNGNEDGGGNGNEGGNGSGNEGSWGGGRGGNENENDSGNGNGGSSWSRGGVGRGVGGNNSSNLPFVETEIKWYFCSALPNLEEIWAFTSRIQVMFQRQATEVQLGHFPNDHKGICTIKMNEGGEYWKLQTGLVYAWVNENASSLNAQSSHAHITATTQEQDGYNYSMAVTGSQTPSVAVTRGKTHSTTTQILWPFYTKPGTVKNEHAERAQALLIEQENTSGRLTGDPELKIDITVASTKDQVKMNIETYWRLVPVRKKSNYNHKDPFRSLEALFICHQLIIPNIFKFSSYTYNKLLFPGHTDGTEFRPEGILSYPGAPQDNQIAEHWVLAGAKAGLQHSYPVPKPFTFGKKKILSQEKLDMVNMVLFRHENGRTTQEEARLEWQKIPNPDLFLSKQ
ncbi:hypothetical protein GYMLUDRAFT_253184 [Collybiopsis luxurians FD-317 M1]|uniref:Uncharacterized protein n=1 Tax=Collybiopsis luxurians FD-317 M1 TaxID=944289 RepID=A0A0D0BXJ3_9AGAR|nr:hypothetical protein GYMLUDRAFT_253184 [Collybiopsis luxurians FD-317 M1]